MSKGAFTHTWKKGATMIEKGRSGLEGTGGDMRPVRLNVRVTREQMKKLKMYCVENDTTISEVVRAVIDGLPSTGGM